MKGAVIVIDPGHGGNQPGAVFDPTPNTPGDEIAEKDITLAVCLALVDILRVDGYNCLLTRDRDVTLSLSARLEIIKNAVPTCAVSVHCNSWHETDRRGVEVYYRDGDDKPLADALFKYLGHLTGMRAKGVFQDVAYLGKRLTILNDVRTPTALVEIGYLSNELDRKYIMGNQYTIAQLLSFGILAYLKDPKLSVYFHAATEGER